MTKFRYSIDCSGVVMGAGEIEAESVVEVITWVLKVIAVNSIATGEAIPPESITSVSVERE